MILYTYSLYFSWRAYFAQTKPGILNIIQKRHHTHTGFTIVWTQEMHYFQFPYHTRWSAIAWILFCVFVFSSSVMLYQSFSVSTYKSIRPCATNHWRLNVSDNNSTFLGLLGKTYPVWPSSRCIDYGDTWLKQWLHQKSALGCIFHVRWQ